MMLTPAVRKFALAAHIMSSIGWFGAVAVFLALAVAGMTSKDARLVRASYLSMELTTWSVIVPLAFLSLLSGVVSSLITNWGLFRYYWVLLKLLMTTFATIVLLIHTQPIQRPHLASYRHAAHWNGEERHHALRPRGLSKRYAGVRGCFVRRTNSSRDCLHQKLMA